MCGAGGGGLKCNFIFKQNQKYTCIQSVCSSYFLDLQKAIKPQNSIIKTESSPKVGVSLSLVSSSQTIHIHVECAASTDREGGGRERERELFSKRFRRTADDRDVILVRQF